MSKHTPKSVDAFIRGSRSARRSKPTGWHARPDDIGTLQDEIEKSLAHRAIKPTIMTHSDAYAGAPRRTVKVGDWEFVTFVPAPVKR